MKHYGLMQLTLCLIKYLHFGNSRIYTQHPFYLKLETAEKGRQGEQLSR